MSTGVTPPELSCKGVYREAENGHSSPPTATLKRWLMLPERPASRRWPATGGWSLVAAGINPRGREVERRAEYDQLRTTGISRQAAEKQVGADSRSAIDWDQGVRKSGRVRIHPNGRVAGNKYHVPKLHGHRARLARIEQQLEDRYLSVAE